MQPFSSTAMPCAATPLPVSTTDSHHDQTNSPTDSLLASAAASQTNPPDTDLCRSGAVAPLPSGTEMEMVDGCTTDTPPPTPQPTNEDIRDYYRPMYPDDEPTGPSVPTEADFLVADLVAGKFDHHGNAASVPSPSAAVPVPPIDPATALAGSVVNVPQASDREATIRNNAAAVETRYGMMSGGTTQAILQGVVYEGDVDTRLRLFQKRLASLLNSPGHGPTVPIETTQSPRFNPILCCEELRYWYGKYAQGLGDMLGWGAKKGRYYKNPDPFDPNNPTKDCFIWLGPVGNDERPRVNWKKFTDTSVRKIGYALCYRQEGNKTPIPKRLYLMCDTPHCMNPAHFSDKPKRNTHDPLNPVSRGNKCRSNGQENREKGECPHGHAYTPENTGRQKRLSAGAIRECA